MQERQGRARFSGSCARHDAASHREAHHHRMREPRQGASCATGARSTAAALSEESQGRATRVPGGIKPARQARRTPMISPLPSYRMRCTTIARPLFHGDDADTTKTPLASTMSAAVVRFTCSRRAAPISHSNSSIVNHRRTDRISHESRSPHVERQYRHADGDEPDLRHGSSSLRAHVEATT